MACRNTHLLLVLTLLSHGFAASEVWGQTSLPLDAKGAFLHADSADAPASPTVINLSDLGLSGGDLIELKYSFATPGFSFVSCGGPFVTDAQVGVIGVFSGSSTFLPFSASARVPDAIDAGSDVFTGPTFFFGEPTDIPEDFRILPPSGFVIQIPAQATHLFVGVADSYYNDNCGSGTVVTTSDSDGDGVPDDQDNCPDAANPDQADADDDGIGDFCEPDGDEDGVADDTDNCVSTPNSDQQDTDGDGAGDACDADDDGDGVADSADNCSLIGNADQADFDSDGQGDACDADVDGDGINDADDQCLGTAQGAATDSVGCSIAQLCPCENPSGWKNHGEYVKCVARTSEDFLDLGLITGSQKDAIVSQAGESQCGR
jgi:Thrombospondin type 3 repeat